MSEQRCSCGGAVGQYEQRERRMVGTFVTVLLRCEKCGRKYGLDHFERINECGQCHRAGLRRTVPVPLEKDLTGRRYVQYICASCGWTHGQDERAPFSFKE